MNPELTDPRDADALDAFWDALNLSQRDQTPPAPASPNEEMIMHLHALMSFDDDRTETRLRRLIFGQPPQPALAVAPVRPMPQPRPAPLQPSRSILRYSSWATAALVVLLVGAIVAAQSAGWLGSRGGSNQPTAIPAAIAQIDATPAALASPTVNDSAIRWTLPFDGTNVEVGATALADGTLYRLIRSDQFTGVQAVDTASGTERWRSAQEWGGNGLGADSSGVYFPTPGGVRAIAPDTGDLLWNISTMVAPHSLTVSNGRIYLWDGVTSLLAIEARDGSTAWKGEAGIQLYEGRTATSQPPVVGENGIAAVSGNRAIAFFDMDGNWITNLGNFDPATIEMALAGPSTLIFTGSGKVGWESPMELYQRQLVSVDLATGSVNWQTDYNALANGLAVIGDRAYVLSDNPGLAVTEVQVADAQGTVTTLQGNPYPEQTSPSIYAFDLDTGQMHFDWDESGSTGHGWVTDSGSSPYTALATGPQGPVAISESGQLDFYSTENPLVQATANASGALPSGVAADETSVYVSQQDGSVIALAPTFTGREAQGLSPSGSINWSMPLTSPLVDFGGMTYGNDLVYRLIETSAGRQIEATSATTGQSAWTLPFDWSTNQIVADPGPSAFDQHATWTGSGNVFVVDSANRLIAIDSRGASSWQQPFAAPVVSMTFDAGTLFVWDESGTMTALNATDGAILWTAQTDNSGIQTNDLGVPIPVVSNTVVAMVDATGMLHGFDRATGDELWSASGFDGTNTRLVSRVNTTGDQAAWLVVLSANGAPSSDGSFDLTVSGIPAETGQVQWSDHLQGPLVQPVSSDETFVTFIGSEAMTGKSVIVTGTPIVDAESPNYYEWTDSGATVASEEPGGSRLFTIDAPTGQIVWIRTSPGPEFTGLVDDPIFARGQALTASGLLVSPSGGRGWIDSAPLDLGAPVLATTSSGELDHGSFATLADGTLVAYGAVPFSQQG